MSCYFCIWKGVHSVGIAAKITVYTPWVILAIFIIYNATLEGSIDGVEAYIGNWDMSALKDGSIWSDAAGQIFFTLGATLSTFWASGPPSRKQPSPTVDGARALQLHLLGASAGQPWSHK